MAFNGLEGFDEAASVDQAQLGHQMQSQLRHLLPDPAADTPMVGGMSRTKSGGASPGFSPKTAWGTLGGGLTPCSPKSQAAVFHPAELPDPGPGYQGPRLEGSAPLTLDSVMSLVRHFQQSPREPLPARYLFRLLDDAEKLFDAREQNDGAVQSVQVPKTLDQEGSKPQLIIVGDTHGQLQDVLWLFYKLGVPSPSNRYLFNGDICDRGELAVEIWALLLAFMSLWPESVMIQRGNHECRLLNMDFNCGGFYSEVLGKYGRSGTGQLVYEKFCRVFARLPLASIVDEQIFVVHGGLSRSTPGKGFLRLLRSNKARGPEIPSSGPGASPVELAFIDAMWSDPQEEPGVRPNPRGSGLVTFGPDWTHRFLAETGMSIIVRSHQVPPNNDGFYQHHGGRLLTVFSASNYCGLAGNQGAVLIYRPGQPLEAVRHWAPALERLAEVPIDAPEVGSAVAEPEADRVKRRAQRKSTATSMEALAKGGDTKSPSRSERLEKQVLKGAARLIVEHKQELFAYFEECDTTSRGFITKQDWVEGLQAVLGDGLPWKAIGQVLQVKDTVTKMVDYRRFLGRFRVAVVEGHSDTGGSRWMEDLLGRFYGRLLALKGEAGSLEELEGFLGGGDGHISPADALEAFRWVLGNTITQEQANALLRTLAAHSAPDPSPVGRRNLGVFEFLSRLDVCYKYEAGVVQGTGNPKPSAPKPPASREATPWARSALSHLGRVLWMEASDGSPKAGSRRMLEVFRQFDKDRDGLLERREFAGAVKALLEEYSHELPAALAQASASDERINELVDCVDVSGDGLVNYLEFLHAFQPVDTTPGRGLRTDLMEQICTTIMANASSLLCTLQVLEERAAVAEERRGGRPLPPGRVSKEILRHTLRSLNASLEASRGSQRGAPLTGDQIDILVDHASVDGDGTLDYKAFLDSFQIVDTNPSGEEEGICLSP